MKAGIAPRESVRLLRFVGQDLPGAVTVEDAVAVSEPAPSVAPSLDGPLRFSLAGVQLKFSAVRNARGGLTIRADGAGGHWIVKLPSLEFANVPENEAATLDFARRCGIVVPEHELVEVSSIEGLPSEIARRAERYALAVQRFDRFPTGEKIHMEDFNQVFRQQPREKYDNHDFASIARVLAVVVGSEALRDFIRRLTFTVAVGNGDMHLKNWSLVYPDGHLPELSPAYDLVPTRGYLPSDDLGLQLGRTKRFEELGAIDLASFAKKADIASKLVVATVNETIEQIREQWKTYRERAPQTLAATVDEQFKRVPLLSSTRS
jgi:serine/threonine-protein kinase HipA